MRPIACFAVGGLALVGLVPDTQAAWVEPVGGWQVSYQAAPGVYPFSPSLPADQRWTVSGYQTGDPTKTAYQQLITSGDSTVLFMDHVNRPTEGWPNYSMLSGYGAGTKDDTITVDFRFRIADASQPAAQAQFQIFVARPTGVAGQQTLFLLNLASGRIAHSSAAGATNGVALLSLSTQWHDARWLIDVAANQAALYLDGASTPSVSHVGALSSPASPANRFQFGDGSSGIIGQAELSYIRITNDSLAAVPEPAALTVAATGTLLLMRRRRQTLSR